MPGAVGFWHIFRPSMNPLLLERNRTWTIIHHPWEKNLPSFHLSRGHAAGMAPDLQAILLPYLRGPYLFLSFVYYHYCNWGRSDVMAKWWWIVSAFLVLLRDQKSSKGNPGGGNSNIFLFSPILREKWSNLTFNIFQMGWFNHQLEMVVFLSLRYPKNWQLKRPWELRSSPLRAPLSSDEVGWNNSVYRGANNPSYPIK